MCPPQAMARTARLRPASRSATAMVARSPHRVRGAASRPRRRARGLAVRGAPLSLILLPTLECNVACDYCFEDKAKIALPPDRLDALTTAILDYMEARGTTRAELYWQGGEVLLLGPAWFERANEAMGRAAAARGRSFHHSIQTNLIGYGHHWDRVLRDMFEGSLGTSMDYPNAHRRLK